MAKTYTQRELYNMVKSVGQFMTSHSVSRTEKFNSFYKSLKKDKAAIRYVEQGNDFDLFIWWNERWNSLNMMVKKVFQ